MRLHSNPRLTTIRERRGVCVGSRFVRQPTPTSLRLSNVGGGVCTQTRSRSCSSSRTYLTGFSGSTLLPTNTLAPRLTSYSPVSLELAPPQVRKPRDDGSRWRAHTSPLALPGCGSRTSYESSLELVHLPCARACVRRGVQAPRASRPAAPRLREAAWDAACLPMRLHSNPRLTTIRERRGVCVGSRFVRQPTPTSLRLSNVGGGVCTQTRSRSCSSSRTYLTGFSGSTLLPTNTLAPRLTSYSPVSLELAPPQVRKPRDDGSRWRARRSRG